MDRMTSNNTNPKETILTGFTPHPGLLISKTAEDFLSREPSTVLTVRQARKALMVSNVNDTRVKAWNVAHLRKIFTNPPSWLLAHHEHLRRSGLNPAAQRQAMASGHTVEVVREVVRQVVREVEVIREVPAPPLAPGTYTVCEVCAARGLQNRYGQTPEGSEEMTLTDIGGEVVHVFEVCPTHTAYVQHTARRNGFHVAGAPAVVST